MATPKKKPVVKAKKKKRKVVIKKTAKVRKEGAKMDSVPQLQQQLPRDNGVTFRIKVKKK